MTKSKAILRGWLPAALSVVWCGAGITEPATSVRAADAPSLYEQSLGALLARHFATPEVSYLLLNVRSGRILGSRWDDPMRPVPMGSLVKPFTALAYGRAHGFRYPEVVCRGEADGCWLRRGHGPVGIEQAIAYSCNAYFARLAARVNLQDASFAAESFGLADGLDNPSRSALIGLGGGWRIAPLAMARAYGELVVHSRDPGAGDLVRGMALSAEVGTGRAVSVEFREAGVPVPRLLAKTGTAPCTHRRKGPGDGYAVVLWPAESPRYVLLVGAHGVPGSRAAAVCGRMLRVIWGEQ